MTALIMIGATVIYFAIAIPVAMWIGRWMSERNK
jgi:hypothetical protein